MKLKLLLCGLFLILSSFNWSADNDSPSSFPKVKGTDPMMLIWPGVHGKHKGHNHHKGHAHPSGPGQQELKKAIKQKAISKKIDILRHKRAHKDFDVFAAHDVKLSKLLVELTRRRIIPPFIIGNPKESVWKSSASLSISEKY
ncbi:hypothetical protein MJH12_12860, partial [bacterium]|nr:hypothetical protein [bacterium]